VFTDWVLIRRLACELNELLGGARVRDVGQLEDGRFGLALWSRGSTHTLCIDIFAATPLITVESAELPIAAEPGFVRAAGAALRGRTLTAARSRDRDRVLYLDFASRSRFGVEDRYSLVCELVPRFGNIVLVKGDSAEPGGATILAAAKEFSPAANSKRSVQAGYAYEPPPSRPGNSSRLIGEETITSIVADVCTLDIHVYRTDGALVQAHVAELPQYETLQHERSSSLLGVLQEARSSALASQQSDRTAKRRRSLERALNERERKLHAEVEQVESRLRQASDRDSLREEGESIYATLHELNEAAREDAKQRAAQLFASYKKAASAVEHLEKRRRELTQALQDIDEVRWELERATEPELEDVAPAIEALERHRRESSRVPTRRRKPLQYSTSNASRMYVGRTPIENADLTFRVARPNDLWFHVRNQPGAHVILQRDDKLPPPQEDIEAAASLAALHSKAKNSPKVTVDYTQRKHVRKRPSAAPGLVFYTHSKSVLVEPGTPKSIEGTPTFS
jgi:predicted ribosome quality control (RQC) complex YloA/Tae2 family protein